MALDRTQPIGLPLQTLYADLRQQAYAETARPGSIYRRTLKGSEYLYAKVPVGNTRVDVFLGRADETTAVERARAMEEEARRAAARRRIVRMLRGAGLPGPTPELGRVLDAIAYAGLFSRGGTLVGTAAYQCYPAMVGYALPSSSLTTQDADLATASLALSTETGESMEAVLRRADDTFVGLPTLGSKTISSRFRSSTGLIVELLTQQCRRTDANPIPLAHLGAGAIPFQHVGWLIQDPVQAVALHGAGVPVTVPQPTRYAVHKLIIAQKRTVDPEKRQKDLAQAAALIEALRRSDPYGLADALAEARAKGATGWAQPIARALSELGIAPDRL